MIKNYLLVAARNFLRNRNYTLINILGLSIGVTSCILIFLLIVNDLRFDTFHSRYNQIYRVVVESRSSSGTTYSSITPYPSAKAFRNDFSEVNLVTQVHYQDDALVKYGTEKQHINNVLFADSLFFEVFDFNVLSGNPRVDLGEPGKVFLTKSMAEKILKGNERGTIRLDNKIELDIAGIIADPPPNSHIMFTMVVSMPSLTKEYVGFPLDRWGVSISGFTYVALPKEITATSVVERFPDFIAKYYSGEDAERKSYHLQPLKEIHFDPLYADNPGPATNADVTDLIGMGIIGAFILVIACINFINLATALAIKKSKEIGIRKTLGAKRSQLSAYFLGETFLLTLFSSFISLCAVEWLLRWLNYFLGLKLELNLLSDPLLIGFILLLILLTTVLAGFYPAIILSGFDPLVVLKNKIGFQGSSGATVRKVLVVFQFMIAQVLIIGTLVISNQMGYLQQKPLGFDRDAIITVHLPQNNSALLESFRTRIRANDRILQSSFSFGEPTSENSFSTGYFLSETGTKEIHRVSVKSVDLFYLDTYGIKLRSGRWFSAGDEKEANLNVPHEEKKYTYIVNESAARRLGFSAEQIIGRKITTGIYDINAEVVGVVEDFHIASLHEEISPVVLMILPQYYYAAGLKVSSEGFDETIAYVKSNWEQLFPEYNFEYEFLDDKLANLYSHDKRTFTLFKIFAGISIFIGCLGLYGLITFMASQKLKEVGIRKVMGASVTSIIILFSKEFIKLIVIAFLLAAPLAWYFMNGWLEGFAYRIPISWTVFVIGIVSTLLIAVLTVSYRSAQAAISNPAETLRTE